MRQNLSPAGFVEGSAFDLTGHGSVRHTIMDTDDCALQFRLGQCASFAEYAHALAAVGCIIRSGASVILQNHASVPCEVPGAVVNGIVVSGRSLDQHKPTTFERICELACWKHYHPCPEETGLALVLQLRKHDRVFSNRVRIASAPFMVDERPTLLGIEGGDAQLFAVSPRDGLYSPDTFWLFWDRSS